MNAIDTNRLRDLEVGLQEFMTLNIYIYILGFYSHPIHANDEVVTRLPVVANTRRDRKTALGSIYT